MSKNIDNKKTIKQPAMKMPVETSTQSTNEGEGSYTGARAYDDGVRQFVESGAVEGAAKSAEKAVDGAEGADLRKAEKAGKRGKA